MIELTNHVLELDQLEELALARAEEARKNWYFSEFCDVGGKRVRVAVHRKKIHGEYEYSALFEADGWRMAKGQLLRELRGEG